MPYTKSQLSAPPVPDDLKKVVRDWKEERKHPTLGTPTHPRVTLQSHTCATFDARLILDALKAVGPKARCYLGRRYPTNPATLFVCRDWSTYPKP